MLFRNDPAAAGQMLSRLVAGQDEYAAGVERFGGVLEAAYPLGGRFDLAAVVGFPDEGSCLAYSLAASAGGQYAEVMRIYESTDLERAEAVNAEALRRFAALRPPAEDE